MNKQTIITILLVFAAMVGNAQIKSGLDLCLRDETTGQWLIGLFDEYVIYDCNYWDYAEVGKGRVVLTKDGQRKDIQLKKNAVVIDGKKHKTSVLTTQFLPDYPSKDETSWPSGINAEEGNFTLRVCVHTTKTEADFVSYIHRLFDDKQIIEHSKIDEQGRFEVRMPVNGPTIMGIHNESEHPLEHTFWGRIIVENNDTLLLYIDDVNQRTYLMGGKYARFNNELLGGDFHPKFVNTNELTIDSTIIQQRHWMTVCQTRMDSLKMARPNLSHRFLTYYQDNIKRQFGYPMILKCCWPSQGENQQGWQIECERGTCVHGKRNIVDKHKKRMVPFIRAPFH